MTAPTHRDVIVIGGGAAGLMCAITAGARGRTVTLIEHNDRIGRKIGISGGGRCNFTNLHASPDNFLSAAPRFCRSALARYQPAQFLALVEKHRIGYHEKTLGQLFCNRSSREIIEMLERECAAERVEIRCGCPVTSVSRSDRFLVETATGSLSADALVIATGGLSFAKLGATDFGHRIARQFGLRVTQLRPGLVPLTFPEEQLKQYRDLSGVSLAVVVRCQGACFTESLLFTHRGLSGPAILQISSYRTPGSEPEIDLLPEITEPDWLLKNRQGTTPITALMQRHWPNRFSERWCALNCPPRPFTQWKHSEVRAVEQRMHHWKPSFSGSEGYPKAEVTLGGVDTRELSSTTMEARHMPGLYFIGEVVDVTGWLGGYNFQWAWASGHAAGEVV